MFVYHNAPIQKVVRCSYIIASLQGSQLDGRISQRHYMEMVLAVHVSQNPLWEGCQMVVYHNATIWNVVRCLYIITPTQGNVVSCSCVIAPLYHSAPMEKVVTCSHIKTPYREVVRCSCIMASLQGRQLDVRISQRSYREGSQMFVYHNTTIQKVVRCSCIITTLQGRQLDVRVS